MRTALLAALLLAGPARAAEGLFYDGTHFGLQAGAGIPSGATASLVVRPWKPLRLDVGVGHDVAAYGLHGGVTLVPFHWWITPTLGVEAGRFAPASFARFAGGSDPAARQILSRIGYDYVSGDLGLEIGGQNRFVFFLRAGLAYLRPTVKDVNAALQAANPGVRISAADPTIRARIPTARVGFLVYVF